MLRFLFQRLTASNHRGQPLFDSVVAEARKPHWYAQGGVADSLDGRFAMLATVCALTIVRLENRGEDGDLQSAALTERFVEAMDAEHRQMGLSDPALGKRVRAMVASLSRRVDEWRSATGDEGRWLEAVRSSGFPAGPEREVDCDYMAARLRELWLRLCSRADSDVARGKVENA